MTKFHSTASDEQQESSRILEGEIMVQVKETNDTDASVVLDRQCLIALNWPAAT
jgi:hypothetical protein